MLAKQPRRRILEARVNLQAGIDTDCLGDFSAAIDTRPLPQLDQPLLTHPAMFFHRRKLAECRLVATMVAVEDQSSLHWTPLMRIGGKHGATI